MDAGGDAAVPCTGSSSSPNEQRLAGLQGRRLERQGARECSAGVNESIACSITYGISLVAGLFHGASSMTLTVGYLLACSLHEHTHPPTISLSLSLFSLSVSCRAVCGGRRHDAHDAQGHRRWGPEAFSCGKATSDSRDMAAHIQRIHMRPFDSPRQQAAKGAAKALWTGQRLAATSWGAAEAGTICVTDSTTSPPWAWRVVGPLGAPLDHMQGKHGSARPHAHTPTHTHLPASSCVPPPAVTPKMPLFRRIPIFLPSLHHCRLRLIPTVPAFTP